MIVFGGADREQCHFQDLIVYSSNTKDSTGGSSGALFTRVSSTGDVPSPRSGHAVAAYGKFMFLSGGIDFHEEVAYNDLYLMDTSMAPPALLIRDHCCT